jgi:F0F1-type ATP synthase membrane subunit b/b'
MSYMLISHITSFFGTSVFIYLASKPVIKAVRKYNREIKKTYAKSSLEMRKLTKKLLALEFELAEIKNNSIQILQDAKADADRRFADEVANLEKYKKNKLSELDSIFEYQAKQNEKMEKISIIESAISSIEKSQHSKLN